MQAARTGQDVTEQSAVRKPHPHMVEALETYALDTAPIDLLRLDLKPHGVQGSNQNDFIIGHSVSTANGLHRFDINGHKVELGLSRPGIYVNPPDTSLISELPVAYDLLAMKTPISHAAHLAGLDEPAFAAAIRPLHDGVVYDDPMIGPLIKSMWHATDKLGSQSTSLFVEQATLTLALYVTNLAHGPDWGKAAFASNEAVNPADAFGQTASPLDRVRLRRAGDYIEAHLAEPMRLADIAAAAMASPSTLSRAFKAATGTSVWAHVQARRLERATEMLTTTGIPIAKIAYACGFSSQAHLTTAFRDRYGATPGQYRQEMGPGPVVAWVGR